jgi:hypothetical protein
VGIVAVQSKSRLQPVRAGDTNNLGAYATDRSSGEIFLAVADHDEKFLSISSTTN